MMRPFKIFIFLIYLLFVSASYADDNDLHMQIPRQLISISIDEVHAQSIGNLIEGDFVDEDISDIETVEWILIYPNGNRISLFAENNIIMRMRITDTFFITDKNIKVGDSFDSVKKAYPGSVFRNGSNERITDDSLFLFADDNKTVFAFNDQNISEEIRNGKVYSIHDNEIKSLKLWGIYIY